MESANTGITAPEIPPGRFAWVRLLSLDVMVGALACGSMCNALFLADMSWAWFVVLPLAVWSIYTLDHLLDAWRLGETANTPRHLFHHRYFAPLAIGVGLSSLICLGLALAFLGINGILFGFWMVGLVVVHLILVKVVGDTTAPWLIKEMGVALIYSAGIWGLPLIQSGGWKSPIVLLLFLQFLLLATINLLEFSWYEQDTDALDGHTSFVRAIGEKVARKVIYVLVGITIAAGILVVIWLPLPKIWCVEGIYAGMLLILLALLRFPGWFAQRERYRAWGDGAFLLPAIYIIVQWLQ